MVEVPRFELGSPKAGQTHLHVYPDLCALLRVSVRMDTRNVSSLDFTQTPGSGARWAILHVELRLVSQETN